jgi:hypothetical protein
MVSEESSRESASGARWRAIGVEATQLGGTGARRGALTGGLLVTYRLSALPVLKGCLTRLASGHVYPRLLGRHSGHIGPNDGALRALQRRGPGGVTRPPSPRNRTGAHEPIAPMPIASLTMSLGRRPFSRSSLAPAAPLGTTDQLSPPRAAVPTVGRRGRQGCRSVSRSRTSAATATRSVVEVLAAGGLDVPYCVSRPPNVIKPAGPLGRRPSRTLSGESAPKLAATLRAPVTLDR